MRPRSPNEGATGIENTFITDWGPSRPFVEALAVPEPLFTVSVETPLLALEAVFVCAFPFIGLIVYLAVFYAHPLAFVEVVLFKRLWDTID